MLITCFNCDQTWDAPEEQTRDARLKSGLGMKEHAFVCPNCQAENWLTEEQVEAAHHTNAMVPVTGMPPTGETDVQRPARARHGVSEAPVNPVPAPAHGLQNRRAVVLVRGVDVLRDHTPRAETMATLHKGERVTILDTWTDGQDVWVQIGPERWFIIERNGEPLLELLDD